MSLKSNTRHHQLCPNREQGMDLLKKIQRKATKMITEMEHLFHVEKLRDKVVQPGKGSEETFLCPGL